MREDAALSQQALARKLGISFQEIQNYETGLNRIPASGLCDIARALGIPVAEFFDDAPHSAAGETDPDTTPVLDLFRRIEDKDLQSYVIGLLRAITRANDN